MSYEQHLKHWKNHRKDKAVQQCSGYSGNGASHQLTEDQFKKLELSSFKRLLEEAKSVKFPVYIACTGGYYHFTDPKHISGARIENYQDLIQFGRDYVTGFADEYITLDHKIAMATCEKPEPDCSSIIQNSIDPL